MANATNETKRIPVISCETGEAGLTLSCVNGQRVVVELANLTDEIKHAAMLHGLKQKLIDAAAISRNPDTGKSASPDDKWQAVYDVACRIVGPAGTWNAPRGEGTGAGNGLLFRALCRLYPAKTPNDLREYLDGKSAKELAALRANPKVAAIIEEIKAEQAKSDTNTDTDAMLAELE